mmetsp:Transcript_23093/g.56953  ORF Transcript_23093/g.56953 Transcript_23093/m.56953 type:complete len:428 (-) Transcript_23093:67-1350(-)
MRKENFKLVGLLFALMGRSANAFSTRMIPSSRPQNLSNRNGLGVSATDTVQDETVDYPASILYYDQVLDDSIPDGVVCARGVCVLSDYDGFDDDEEESENSLVDSVLNSYLGPRLMLAGASILYGTNFPLGAIMNDALPPSAATCARMVLAAVALSPFLPKLSPSLSGSAILCGCFTALGYTTQSLALVDVSPATVAFLGAATVIVCPTLEALVDKKPMGISEAPQTWLAATLCILGVGVLELYDPSGAGMLEVGWGDALAILQAIGFGTSFFLTERMMRGQPDQALPITAVQVSVTAFICMLWCFADGWMFQEGSSIYALPNLFFEPSIGIAAGAIAWTGLITTAVNRFVETTSLGKVASAEASVILATEPLFAALFASLWLSETFGANDYIGGALIVAACLANTLKPGDFSFLLNAEKDKDAFSP